MLRGFTDSTGVEWRVWEVFPTEGVQSSADALTRSRLQQTPFANGWLCFESATEKRRLAPIPPGWELRDPRTLEIFCRKAEAVTTARRRNQPSSVNPTSTSSA